MLHDSLSGFDADADEVIEVSIWKPLDIQIDRRSIDLQLRAADDVDLALQNREGFQRMMILLALGNQLLWPPAWPEGIGELRNSEDAFAVELPSFLLCHARQQAEIFFFNRLLPAPGLKFTLGTMPNEAPRSKLRGITELNFEDFSEAEANPVASYGECSSSK